MRISIAVIALALLAPMAAAQAPADTSVAADDRAIVAQLTRQALREKQPDHAGDLIKIGLPLLGAIVGAMLGFLGATRTAEVQRLTAIEVARTKHRTDLAKELGNRRALRFDELLSRFDAFCQRLSNYVTLVKNSLEKSRVSTISADKLAAIDKCEADFSNGFLDLINAESKLLVLGYEDLQKQFREFGEAAQALFRKVHLNNATLTVEEIDLEMGALRSARQKLLLKIGEEERRWWQT